MKQYIYIIGLLMLTTNISCDRYLDAKPDKALAIASSTRDFRAMLDYPDIMNTFVMGVGEASSDNYYLTDADYNGFIDKDRNMYAWGDEIIFGNILSSYFNYYRVIYYANAVVEGFDKDPTLLDDNEGRDIKGAALFFRALNHFRMATAFAGVYDENNLNGLGVPIRTSTDFNVPTTRASIGENFEFILRDLQEAVALLNEIAAHPYRPSKLAALALQARVFLYMGKYEQAASAAGLALEIRSDLMDYNDIDLSAPFTFDIFNKEVIFHLSGDERPIVYRYGRIDTLLLDSYEKNDLRLRAYFIKNEDGTSYRFKGSYNGNRGTSFMGLAIDDLYLVYTESLVRIGKVDEAQIWLNRLLSKRYEKETFIPVSLDDQDALLQLVLEHRRKELVMRDYRWEDIKRLNREGGNISLKRIINGQEIKLEAGSPRFALPFPRDIIEMAGIPQNPR